eukprot:NODE_10081_length_1377_cov_13.209600.p1 GENE.NODE_10081_length_1377_cov_13.209600~~NODE_10081_length_1377_cov_13.209600.p1  ORF type:complete len:371 (+),score=68.02 NODE_10081_length_1377_cov_13.209600:89-1114(+)
MEHASQCAAAPLPASGLSASMEESPPAKPEEPEPETQADAATAAPETAAAAPAGGSEPMVAAAASASSAATGAQPAEQAAVAHLTGAIARKDDWDPVKFACRQPTSQCLKRVQRDFRQVCRDPLPGTFVFADENEATVAHCLLAGNEGTPYEGGMFYFYVSCPDDYPMSPPRVRLMTTGSGTCGFNPNLYPNGKVCLSILHTWTGPGWQPVHSLASVLVSIQSLMHDRPYHNEPGYETERYPGDTKAYNDVIRHQTLAHGVLGMMRDAEDGKLPASFGQALDGVFLAMFEGYEEVCEANQYLDGQVFRCPFNINRGAFRYGEMLKELHALRPRVEARSGLA